MPRVLVLELNSLGSARDLIKSHGLQAVLREIVVPPIPTGVLPGSITANLPAHRIGVLAAGVELTTPEDAATTRIIFIDVLYDDAPNHHREERLREGAETREVPLRITLFNRALRTYRFTFVDNDGSVHRGKFTEINESIISIAEESIGTAGGR